ncbi:aldolase catalytic domain-containing protein [Cobetia crustatorum]|uniref:aldolase catalytic domain-containing protein n=1 Tax=Cobetia crustatorum TaxID=553385 RepID=UPI0004BAD5A3|nr:aldolase catalytic domain-containing protein [Cobetia crustatorum]
MIYLDCTLRDGGYYNNWDFPESVVKEYIRAMDDCGITIVEMGLRSLKNTGFKGASAFSTDDWLASLEIPASLKVGVMVNASELLVEGELDYAVLEKLFPNVAEATRLDVVRIACHFHEFERSLPASNWLKERGFLVGYNLMQIADKSQEDVEKAAQQASAYPLDSLYFADSMGSMYPDDAAKIIRWLRSAWTGALGIHTHDNMGLALSNTKRSIEEGVTWVDSTVTGMGRGPGNASTEEVAINLIEGISLPNTISLLELIDTYFKPLQAKCGWGKNPYYFLAGMYGIHPSYIQEMQADSRYSTSDIISVINKLKKLGASKFSSNTLEIAKSSTLHDVDVEKSLDLKGEFSGKNVLLLGTGPSSSKYAKQLQQFATINDCVVIAMNTDRHLSEKAINYRIVCHPVRMLADQNSYDKLEQPLIAPLLNLSSSVRENVGSGKLINMSLKVEDDTFAISDSELTCPKQLVAAYSLAVSAAAGAKAVYLAGFDGYAPGDKRNQEMQLVLDAFAQSDIALPVTSITPSVYDVQKKSLYGEVA